MSAVDLLRLSNPVFKGFVFYATACVGKMMLMSILTAKNRISKKVFANPEDAKGLKGAAVNFVDPDVERVRRNHLNDLENIPAFIFVGLFYVLINPDISSAIWHFRIFFFSRVFHTIAYQLPLPQPSRALGFFAGVGVTISMMYRVLQASY